ncbi:MAG: molybdenum cofactor biosynthesis protein, partial [Dietzia sp.]|nr:molybdenum cofactor biosynthesis protein [Dietzia sp.]
MSTRFDPRSLPGGRRIQTDVDFDPSAAVPADTPIAGRAMVVVVTDRLDPREDSIGPLVTELLEEEGFLVGGVVGVASEESEVRKALETAVVGGF